MYRKLSFLDLLLNNLFKMLDKAWKDMDVVHCVNIRFKLARHFPESKYFPDLLNHIVIEVSFVS